ncbi:MAG: peptidylprolyl isomerase [Planctomycetota bacterium]|nr:peptidylprolyl isomerase [Planctomycetota bacterium]
MIRLLLVALAGLAAPALLAAEEPGPGDKSMARLGDLEVRAERVWRIEKAWLESERARDASFNPLPNLRKDKRREIAERELRLELIVQYAKKENLSLDDAGWAEFMKGFAALLEGQQLRYEQWLANQGANDAEFQRWKRAQLAVMKKLGADITGDDVKAAFEARRDDLPLRRCAHLLLLYEGSAGAARSEIARPKEQAQALAAEALKKLKAGADFAQLARELSECPSRERGGDLGFIPRRGPWVRPFCEALYKLDKPGGLSEVVETEFGFHVLRFAEARGFEDFEKDLREALAQEKLARFEQQLTFHQLQGAVYDDELLARDPPWEAKP